MRGRDGLGHAEVLAEEGLEEREGRGVATLQSRQEREVVKRKERPGRGLRLEIGADLPAIFRARYELRHVGGELGDLRREADAPRRVGKEGLSQERARQSLPTRVVTKERVRESRKLDDEGAIRVCISGRVPGGLEVAEEGGVEQLALVREVEDDGSGRDPGRLRDSANVRAVEPLLLELRLRHLEDARARDGLRFTSFLRLSRAYELVH